MYPPQIAVTCKIYNRFIERLRGGVAHQDIF